MSEDSEGYEPPPPPEVDDDNGGIRDQNIRQKELDRANSGKPFDANEYLKDVPKGQTQLDAHGEVVLPTQSDPTRKP